MSGSAAFDAFLDRRLDAETREDAKRSSCVICAAEPGCPVIFVSDEFEAHTGYARHEIIGKSLAVLQGPDTEAEAIEAFRDLIRDGRAGFVQITNYRADGTRFVHECDFRPVRGDADEVTHFIAIQRPV